MKSATSLYLDICRFCAAMVVFLGHASFGKWSGGFLWQIAPFGQRAVDIFFVLSGFVIAYVVDGKENDAETYAASRFARIYSVALPSLILTFLLNILGQSIDTSPYVSIKDYGNPNQLLAFIASITFCNELWFQHFVFGTNEPYWSLGFEVWYYIIFGLFMFSPRRWRWVAAVAAVAVAGPKVAILFPLWLVGVGCYAVIKKGGIGPKIGLALFLASIIAFACYWETWAQHGKRPFDPFTLEPKRLASYLDNYATGLLFAVNIVGFDGMAGKILPLLSRFSRQIRWVAGSTFSLYLFHQPIIELLVAMSPWSPSSAATRAMVTLGTLAIVLGLAQLTERYKSVWRKTFLATLRLARTASDPRGT